MQNSYLIWPIICTGVVNAAPTDFHSNFASRTVCCFAREFITTPLPIPTVCRCRKIMTCKEEYFDNSADSNAKKNVARSPYNLACQSAEIQCQSSSHPLGNRVEEIPVASVTGAGAISRTITSRGMRSMRTCVLDAHRSHSNWHRDSLGNVNNDSAPQSQTL
jgi:hypothetical protein